LGSATPIIFAEVRRLLNGIEPPYRAGLGWIPTSASIRTGGGCSTGVTTAAYAKVAGGTMPQTRAGQVASTTPLLPFNANRASITALRLARAACAAATSSGLLRRRY
jgi:hypothetical protein